MNNDNTHEIKLYFQFVIQWLWLLILLFVIGIIVGYYVHLRLPKTYTSGATVLVGNFILSPNPTADQIETSEDLALVYTETIKTSALIQDLITKLDLDISIPKLWDQISVSSVRSLITIEVTFADPETAYLVAEEIVNNLTNVEENTKIQVRLELIDTQLDALDNNLVALDEQLAEIDGQLASTNLSIIEKQLLEDQHTKIEMDITTTLARISDLQTIRGELDQTSNVFTLVQPPEIPKKPDGAGSISFTILSGFLGIIIAILAALLYNIFDTRIHSQDYLINSLGLRILGKIPSFSKGKKISGHIITHHSIRPEIREAYRFVLARLITEKEFNSDAPLRTYMLVSPQKNSGTTTTSINLGVTLANAGFNVLLIHFHSSIGKETIQDLEAELLFQTQSEELYDTNIQNLRMMLIEDISVQDKGTLTVLRELQSFMQQLEQKTTNIVIIDTPAITEFADAVLLNAVFNLEVIIVVKMGQFKAQDIKDIRELFPSTIGCIINQHNESP